MKKITGLLAVLLMLGATSLFAQNDVVTDAPIAKPREPEKEKVPWNERIVFGGSMGLQFGTFTNINLSPIVGYKVTESLVLGAGPTYIYTSVNYGGVKYRYSVYGGRLYGRQRIVENFFAQAEYEFLNVQNYYDPNNRDARKWISAPLVGGTYVQPIGNNSAFVLSVLFNLNYQPNLTPYANPIIRVGFNL
jgi:hypothetical protein